MVDNNFITSQNFWGRTLSYIDILSQAYKNSSYVYSQCTSYLCLYHFSHQTARKSIEIMCSCGNHWSVMVINWKYHNPVLKPPLLFYPMLACKKGGGRICGDSTVDKILKERIEFVLLSWNWLLWMSLGSISQSLETRRFSGIIVYEPILIIWIRLFMT